jgi:4'-phosphopantetheinyl transferase
MDILKIIPEAGGIHNPSLSIAILKMEEDMDYSLLIKDSKSIEDIVNTEHKSSIRKQQLFAARYLLQELTNDDNPYVIGYTKHGKPFIKVSDWEISISHTKEYIALILSKDRKAGIDIEVLDPRILRIEKKFLRDDEKEFMNPNYYLEQLYIIWSVKETLFKIHERGGLIFKENLKVHPFEFQGKGTVQADITIDEFHKTYSVNYEQINKLMLVYATE